MSSSSSSDVGSNEYFYGEMNQTTPWPMQPLIYYTHVPNRQKQRSKERKKQNCFARAFRWYTQERNPCQRTNSNPRNAPDIRGFATWLDEKYTEYLQENQCTRDAYKPTSSADMDEVSNNLNACESCSPKRTFKTFKSPRKRHRKLTNSKDRGNVLIRSNKSFEIILHPKNLSRAASEIPRQVSRCTNSTATIVKAKSQSLTSVLVEKEVYSFPYDTVHIDDVDKTDKKRGMPNACCEKCSATPTINTTTNTTAHPTKHQQTNASCQYGQFERKPSSHRPRSPIKKSKVICACLKLPSPSQNQIKQSDQKISPDKSSDVQKCPPTCLRNNDVKTKTTSAERFNDGTQTSDCPINLATAQFPLFMKILCTDRVQQK